MDYEKVPLLPANKKRNAVKVLDVKSVEHKGHTPFISLLNTNYFRRHKDRVALLLRLLTFFKRRYLKFSLFDFSDFFEKINTNVVIEEGLPDGSLRSPDNFGTF